MHYHGAYIMQRSRRFRRSERGRIATTRERFRAMLGPKPRSRVLLEASTECEWVVCPVLVSELTGDTMKRCSVPLNIAERVPQRVGDGVQTWSKPIFIASDPANGLSCPTNNVRLFWQ